MAYKNKEDQAANAHAHYQRNKETMKARAQARKVKNKAILREMILKAKSVPCADCKQTFIPWAMDFDHISNDKEFTIAQAASRGLMPSRVAAEIAKCEVVCATCHRIRTYNRIHGAGRLQEFPHNELN